VNPRLILFVGLTALALIFSAVERQRRIERAQIEALYGGPLFPLIGPLGPAPVEPMPIFPVVPVPLPPMPLPIVPVPMVLLEMP